MRKDKLDVTRLFPGAMASPIANPLFGNRYMPVFEKPDDQGTGGSGDDNKDDDTGDKSGGSDDGDKVDDKSGDKSGDGDQGKDKSKVSDKEAELMREVMSKKETITDLKSKLENLEKAVAKFDGLDPEAAKAALSEKEKAEQEKLEKRGEWDRLKEQLLEKHQKTVDEKDQTIADLKSQLNGANEQNQKLTIGHSFDSSSFIQDEMVLTSSKARVIYGNHFEVEDGEVVAYDKPAGASERTMLVNDKGDPLDFNSAIKVLVEKDPEHESLIKSTVRKGADSKTTDEKADDKEEVISSQEKISSGIGDLVAAAKKSGDFN